MIIGNLVVADWFLAIVIAVFFSAIGSAFYWLYTVRLQRGNKAVIVTKAGGVAEELLTKKFKSSDKEFTAFGEKFSIDLTKPHHRKFNWTYYFYDLKDQSMLTLGGTVAMVSSADRNKYINKDLWSRIMSLVTARPAQFTMVIVMLAILAVVTGLLGYLIYPAVNPIKQGSMVVKLVFGL